MLTEKFHMYDIIEQYDGDTEIHHGDKVSYGGVTCVVLAVDPESRRLMIADGGGSVRKVMACDVEIISK